MRPDLVGGGEYQASPALRASSSLVNQGSSPAAVSTVSTCTEPNTITRPDAPVVRNVRRVRLRCTLGPARGLKVVEAELRQDRVAKSAIPSQETWISTWRRFHYEAFELEVPAVPMLPVTGQSMVAIGSIFKKGGYRSFPIVCHRQRPRISRPTLSGANSSRTRRPGYPGACSAV